MSLTPDVNNDVTSESVYDVNGFPFFVKLPLKLTLPPIFNL